MDSPITEYADVFRNTRVLLYVDADMLFVGPVDVTSAAGLIAVEHPGYVSAPTDTLPFERRRESAACVSSVTAGPYFCGGVQGGATETFLSAAASIDENILADEQSGVTAIWHDESHWNRYLIDHPPQLTLGAEYACPDYLASPSARILALSKNHDFFRGVNLRRRIAKRLREAVFALKSQLIR